MGVGHLQDHDLQKFELSSSSASACLRCFLKPDLEGKKWIDYEITNKCTCSVTMNTSWHRKYNTVQTVMTYVSS